MTHRKLYADWKPKGKMRFYLFDVDENRAHHKHAKRATGKNDFGTLEHAKRYAEKTYGKLSWTSQDNLNADQSITKWYFGAETRGAYPVAEIRHASKKGITPVLDYYLLKNPKRVGPLKRVPDWEYETAIGVPVRGTLDSVAEYQGGDVTYFFVREKTGQMDLVSGSQLKKARRIRGKNTVKKKRKKNPDKRSRMIGGVEHFTLFTGDGWAVFKMDPNGVSASQQYFAGPGQAGYDAAIKHLAEIKMTKKRNPVAKKKSTTVRSEPGVGSTVRFYETDIVQTLPGNKIKLQSGGWLTATTKSRMNEAADDFGLGFKVYSKGGTRKEPKWWIDDAQGKTHKFVDGMIIPGPTYMNPKGRKKMAKKKRSAKQLANDKRLGRMAKARAKKKRGKNPRRKVSRRKVSKAIRAREVKRLNLTARQRRGRPALKKSHLWLAFVCWPNRKVNYAYIADSGTKPRVGISPEKGNAVLFKTKTRAHNVAKLLAKNWGGATTGVANADATAAEIKAACKGKA